METKQTGRLMWYIDGVLEDAQVPQWRERCRELIPMLEAHLSSEGLRAVAAPPILPPAIEHCAIEGVYRLLAAYRLYTVLGWDEHGGEDGDGAPIYGPPCWSIRVDTLAE